MYSREQQKFLLNLARESISYYLDHKRSPDLDGSGLETALKEKRGVFVTLTIDGRLRGCIGHLLPVNPLFIDVIENAVNAAFDDPRFDPLSKSELDLVKIEISVLSRPRKLEYLNSEELLNKLIPLKHGVILKQGFYQATYLPQVWEDLSDKELFLGSLCQKAGLNTDEWVNGHPEIQVYTVEKFEE